MTGISRKLPDTERTRLKAILQEGRPGGRRRHRPHRGRGRQRGGAVPRRRPADRAVGGHREEVGEGHVGPDAALRRAGPDDPRRPRHLQRGLRLAGRLRRRRLGHARAVRRARRARPAGSGCRAGPARRTSSPSTAIDEQLAKALDRKVWLPSGGYLVIDRTEAMIVVDVNTGKFTGAGRQPRGDGHQEQPRGGRGDRPPAPAARPRRHHRHRLHRHGAREQPRPRPAPADRVPRPRPDQAPGRRGDLARAWSR